MTDMNRLREAVARAVCLERCAFYGDPPCHALPDFKGCESDEKCGDMATAAILAVLKGIREPSEAMRIAGLMEHVKAIEADAAELQKAGRIDGGTAVLMTVQSDEPVTQFYRAMIDQAIKEVGGGAA